MTIKEKIIELASQEGIISLSNFNNVEKNAVFSLCKNNQLKRVAKGLYALSDILYDELYYLQQGTKAIYSHNTALYLHNITPNLPRIKHITLPPNYIGGRLFNNAKIKAHRSKYYDIGISTIRTEFNNEIKIYNMEKTICDVIALYKNDNELNKVLINYCKRTDKNIPLLHDIALQMGILERVKKKVAPIMKLMQLI